MSDLQTEKHAVAEFWNKASCGEELFLSNHERESFEYQAKKRYQLEPYLVHFADFPAAAGKSVLEIGVGLGADHERFALSGAILSGIDLTTRAISNTKERFAQTGLQSNLQVADAENLPFPPESFDLVYSWGVIHHSPNTARCVEEIYRVLRPGGQAKIMIYHKYSMIGYMLWVRYAGLTLRWNASLADIYSRYLESPGTKAYTVPEARALFGAFENVAVETVLTHGDLLTSGAGQRHRGPLLTMARLLFPRWLVRKLLPGHGLHLMVTATKRR